MDIWLGVAVGAFVACVLCLIIFLFRIGTWYVGDLRVDRSDDPEKPYYFMEVSKGASFRMLKNNFVLLRVKQENYVKNE